MTRASTVMTWIAVVLFLGAYAFPLWSISLDAPQYPEGMGMKIWIAKITGKKPHDLKNINGLNHYIGMKEIHAESIPELRFMKFIVGFLMLFGAVAAVTRKRSVLVAWVIVSIVVALAGLADFYRWSYDYGHDLDPDAPIKVPGMTYQPPLIGSKQLLNITATSLPGLGGIMMMAGVALGFVAVVMEWRRGRSARKGALALVIAAVALAASCAAEPSPIRFGADTCDYCRMTIADERFGSEIVTKKGRHAWISSKPLDKWNIHERCNLGARHRWGIESGFLVEKCHGYQYEHCFAYHWQAMKGYHYLMRLGHMFNVLAHYSERLVSMVKEMGVRGLIHFIRETISGPWLDPLWVKERLAAPFQLRLV